jgi:hypothetical protein
MRRARIRQIGGLAAAAALLAAGCSWGQYGHDASRTGWSPAEDVITPANVTSLAPLWSGPQIVLGARIAHGTIYSIEGLHTEGQRLVAYDAAGVEGCTGPVPRICTPRWTANLSVRLNANRLYEGVAVEGNRVYVVGAIPFFAAGWRMEVFDALGREGCSGVPVTCGPLWSATWGIGSDGARLAVAQGKVFVSTPSDPMTVSAFDAAGVEGCGAGPPRTCTSLFTTIMLNSGAVAVSNGRLVVDVASAGVAVYDASGRQGCVDDVCSPLSQAQGLARVSVAAGRLYSAGAAFDLATPGCAPQAQPEGCTPTWRMAVQFQPLFVPPVVADGQVYVGRTVAAAPGVGVEVFDAAGIAGCSGVPKVCQPQAVLAHGSTTFALAATKSLVFVTGGSTPTVPRGQLHAFALAGPTTCAGNVPRVCEPLHSLGLRAAGVPGPISIANGIVVVPYDNGGFDVFALRAG